MSRNHLHAVLTLLCVLTIPPFCTGYRGVSADDDDVANADGEQENAADGDGNGNANGNGNGNLPIGNAPGVVIGGGQGSVNGGNRDPLAERIQAASELLKAQSEFMLAEGEYLNLLADARIKVAEAVDLELDLWKKKVLIYFERHEENMRSKMRRKDLYDVAADQTLRLKDTAARRRYEYMKRHPRLSGRGSHTNLNFMLDQFVGTPIGYGIPLEETFSSNTRHERWKLDETMHSQLKIKQDNGIDSIEFLLNQPTPIAFDWPDVFREEAFSMHRSEIERLNSIVAKLDEHPTNERNAMHQRAAERMQRVFASMSQKFFELYPDYGRQGLTTAQWRAIMRGEDFLSQKTVELEAYRRNPERLVSASTIFDPDKDGRDAGTLIAFMSRNGLKFSKPSSGSENAYHSLYTMMMELYALYGEPLAEVAKTEVSERPQPPEREPAAEGIEGIEELIQQP
ncbi:hypothetical protein [Neorhodopirellula pilleata]|uniref:Uncharacterized protein n=1 Tax=Neorhodopirellula pilleata TaxID=2714738 RepID=A0A5C6AW12_9BACT|nr:hypothetical protein [Neorhodopirellula pilleata]TWU03687.1 hypothetical protein Pla100_06170 [Neorhodopirellula pilleata]